VVCVPCCCWCLLLAAGALLPSACAWCRWVPAYWVSALLVARGTRPAGTVPRLSRPLDMATVRGTKELAKALRTPGAQQAAEGGLLAEALRCDSVAVAEEALSLCARHPSPAVASGALAEAWGRACAGVLPQVAEALVNAALEAGDCGMLLRLLGGRADGSGALTTGTSPTTAAPRPGPRIAWGGG
jgi:hypothetical protein